MLAQLEIKKKTLKSNWLLLLVILSTFGFVLWQTAHWTRQAALENLQRASQHQLNLYISNLQGQLQKYEYLPELLATNTKLIQQLKRPADGESAEALSRYLETINRIADASDTYLMDVDGLTIAASNWDSERPFVGRNFSYRPYFQEAMKGHLGRYFALGTTSNKRGYYFAYPVRSEGIILGAVVIKINMAPIEESWSQAGDEFIVTDPDGVIFVTTRKNWRFKTLLPLRDEVKRKIVDSRRYADADLGPLPVDVTEELAPGGVKRVKLGAPYAGNYMMLSHTMPEAGWRVHILTRFDPVNMQIIRGLLFSSILFAATVLLIMFWVQRQKRLNERARYERMAKKNLEVRVKARTKDLTETNARLTREIGEHRRTEEALRKTQDELIQAAKMAVLGQMSTGISHELNQPLAAIRSYADNARALLEKKRLEDTAWNLEQISELTKRMATISSQLKVFARKTSGQLVCVSLPAVIDRSLQILSPRIKQVSPQISLDLPGEELHVLADMVHLEQVLVNLISNALHAVDSEEERRLELAATRRDGRASITIRDSGYGIRPEHLGRIFDPFFTTKEEGLGLGLGLSISYRIVEAMNGALRADNHPGGGAIFTLELPACDAPADEPEQESA